MTKSKDDALLLAIATQLTDARAANEKLAALVEALLKERAVSIPEPAL